MDYRALVEEAIRQFPAGAFLVSGDEANPMTIGWGQFGVVWGKPTLTIMVRHSRYSEQLLQQNGNFTVSFPAPGTMKEALIVCGRNSGRDMDKKAAAGLETVPARVNGVPGIAGCAIHFECRTMLRSEFPLDGLDKELYDRFYAANGDLHVLYFGEILAAYRDGENDA